MVGIISIFLSLLMISAAFENGVILMRLGNQPQI